MHLPRPRKLITPLTSISVCMSSSSKTTNPYNTLNVAQNATQEEIKTAYYKLTKQYHPDVNKTKEAKEKFRDVSEAYETIGNYKARRQYDRGMTARATTVRSDVKDEKEPEHMAFYRSRMKAYPKPVRTADNKVYDFDAWTRAHYGDTLKRTLHKKQTNIDVERSRYEYSVNSLKFSRDFVKIIGIFILILSAITFAEIKENFDDVAINKPEESEKKSE